MKLFLGLTKYVIVFYERIKMKKILSMACICLALSACQNTRFVFSDNVPSQPSYTGVLHYIFWGKKGTVNAAKICGSSDNVVMVEETETTSQSFLRGITAGVYSPITVKVYCKRPVKSSYHMPQPK